MGEHIKEITVENFKAVRHVSLKLGSMTAFIGTQDAGKSSILQAVALLLTGTTACSRHSSLTECLFEYLSHDLLRAPRAERRTWQELLAGFRAQVKLKKRIIELEWRGSRFVLHGFDPVATPRAFYVHLSTESLRRPVYVDTYPPRLAPDGENLPAVLAALQGEHLRLFLDLQERFRGLVPTVREILLRRLPVVREEVQTITVNGVETTYTIKRQYMGDCLAFRLTTGEVVPAEAMSDGAMRILGYLTALMAPPTPEILLVEGPEEGIHPESVKHLVRFFRAVQEERGVQILMTTHSPDFVSWLEPHEIVLVRRGADGYTEARRMDEIPHIDEWMEVMSPGELWLLKGEEELIDEPSTGEVVNDGE